MNCPICNKLLADGSTFCDGCGANVSEAAASTVLCAKCGLPTAAGEAFCQNCGAPVASGKKSGFADKLKQIPKKFIAIGAAVVAVILVAAIVLPLVLGASASKNKSVAYVKDGEMFFLSKANGKPVQVTTKLFDDFEHEQIASATSSLSNYVVTTADGSRMFFVDKVDPEDDGPTLFYKNPKKEKQEPVKIDSNIEEFYVNEKGNHIVYLKENKIYEYDLKEKTKIADDVSDFVVSLDTKTVVYETYEDGIYLKKSGKDKVELTDEEGASLGFVTEDFKVIYFTEEDTLYRYNDGEKKAVKIDSAIVDHSYDANGDIYYVNEDNELMYRAAKSDKDVKIDTDVKNLTGVYEGGKFYYTKSEETEEGIAKYITDDMKASDAEMVEPEYPDSDDFYPEWPNYSDFDWPSYSDFDDYDDYRAEYERVEALYDAAKDEYYEKWDEADALYDAAIDEYYVLRDAWYEKENRDELRADIEDYEFALSVSTYFYYDGKKGVELCKNVGDRVDYAYDAVVVAYKVYGEADVKVKLSEIDYLSEVESMVKEKLNESASVKIFVEGNVLSFDVEEYRDFRISDDGKTLYYITEWDEDDSCGDLYSAEISAKKLGKATKASGDVHDYFVLNGDIHYFCDVDTEDEEGVYYVNGKKVLEDVFVGGHGYNEDLNIVTLRTDYDRDKGEYTLYIAEDGKAKKVGEEINKYTILANGDVYFLKDVSDKNYKGDLYVYTGGKEAKKVDEDVYGIVRFYTTTEIIELRQEEYWG